MAKHILYQDQARRALERGIDCLAAAVAITLGPKGRNVLIEQSSGIPQIVNDGVTIAQSIELADPIANMGVSLMREAAFKTNDLAGDGTTTAIVLTHAMVKEGLRNVVAGANAVALNRGMNQATAFLVAKITEYACPVSGTQAIAQVGAIAAGNQDEVGQMIADAMAQVGPEGVILLEEGKSMDTELEVNQGMRLDTGYLSPYFVTDPDRMEALMIDPYILITDQIIASAQDLIPLLELVVQAGKPLVLIAADIEREALATLVINRLRSILKITAIKAPGFGDRRKAFLEDIASLTGGTVITAEAGLRLDGVQLNQLGMARQFTVNKDTTTIVAAGYETAVQARCDRIRQQIAATDLPYEREQLQERLAKLAGGVAVIKVGAATETELHDRKLRLEDALNATRAAVAEGIVPGGGATLLHLAPELERWARETLAGEELTGALIVMRSLAVPLRQIVDNAGGSGPVIVEKVQEQGFSTGYNAMNGELVDMVSAGIIDAAKVTRLALQSATAIASMILTTECVVSHPLVGAHSDN